MIAENLKQVLSELPEKVRLVAVSKFHPYSYTLPGKRPSLDSALTNAGKCWQPVNGESSSISGYAD